MEELTLIQVQASCLIDAWEALEPSTDGDGTFAAALPLPPGRPALNV